ncbi:MAG TPA: phosphoenolpyruvate carboxykinase (ATP) [Bacteroidia bacterium]|nr:phosphoenolpyruvate carboxykinase (ATP) [Bacteroidia bacterium]
MNDKKQEYLEKVGLAGVKEAFWNLSVPSLVGKTLLLEQGSLTDTGALACDTGEFTGRSPKDKFVVFDENTKKTIWWGDINNKISIEAFQKINERMNAYLISRDVYIKDAYACASDKYKLNIRVITEYPWQNLFAHNLFLRPTATELTNFTPEWTILCAPGFKADPKIDFTRAHNFTIINFTLKTILIGGSAYTGEIKKGIFTVLNYLLPLKHKALSMHCSANIGKDGDTAVFFGLSGTGKTTLSADSNRKLIGDDEHGWDEDSVFNFEGGCYAKCVNLSQEKEPQIFGAIKFGTLLENIEFKLGTETVDYDNVSKTENTRAAYPIDFIENSVEPSIGKTPKNIFFLTADAFGVLPPISKLNVGQAMYHFISGYTAKVAGTEAGITEPQTTFSACFGKPFLPLHPTQYAELLGEKLKDSSINVWLINTGWTGGSYGTGERIKLSYTRTMITSALNGELSKVQYKKHEIFGLLMPLECPNVPSELLNPSRTWKDKNKYEETAMKLAQAFQNNFEQYKNAANAEIIAGGPQINAVEKETK